MILARRGSVTTEFKSEFALRDHLETNGVRSGEVMGLVQDIRKGIAVTLENGTEYWSVIV